MKKLYLFVLLAVHTSFTIRERRVWYIFHEHYNGNCYSCWNIQR